MIELILRKIIRHLGPGHLLPWISITSEPLDRNNNLCSVTGLPHTSNNATSYNLFWLNSTLSIHVYENKSDND